MEIITGSHVTEKKKIGSLLFPLSKMAIGKGCGKGFDFKKVGIAKSSSVYKCNIKSVTCPVTICR
jgi:hypothetical protein